MTTMLVRFKNDWNCIPSAYVFCVCFDHNLSLFAIESKLQKVKNLSFNIRCDFYWHIFTLYNCIGVDDDILIIRINLKVCTFVIYGNLRDSGKSKAFCKKVPILRVRKHHDYVSFALNTNDCYHLKCYVWS